MTGLSGSGKSTIAKLVQKRMIKKGFRVEVIDGDEYREGLCKDLGFSKEDRNINIRRLAFVGKILSTPCKELGEDKKVTKKPL